AARLLDDEMVKMLTEPVRVADLIIRAGGDQQLVGVVESWDERRAGLVTDEGEATLEAAGQVRIGSLPTAIFAQGQQSWQAIGVAQPFEDEIGNRRGRLANGKARMPSFFQQDCSQPQPLGDQGHQRACEASTQNQDVRFLVDSHWRPPHAQTMAGASCWL